MRPHQSGGEMVVREPNSAETDVDASRLGQSRTKNCFAFRKMFPAALLTAYVDRAKNPSLDHGLPKLLESLACFLIYEQ